MEPENSSTKPDSFVMDMERFENSNSRITLQRNLSRKGSQMRSMEKKIPNPNVAIDNLISTSPRGVLHGAGTPEKPMVVVVGNGADHSAPVTIISGTGINPSESKTIAAGKKFGFRRPSSPSWILDPRRILLFFATLSSMGTMLLIYLSLSVSKYSGDESALD